jgi:arylsulfatase A-like enzyme
LSLLNILLITLDQFRADCLSCAGHPVVKTPHLDALAADGVRLARHYSQSSPCSPGRASLYTGMYQLNHRVVANGTPLDRRFDNVALAARRAGYVPALFGYTDQSVDPRDTTGPSDPRLQTYEGILPGFEGGLFFRPTEAEGWISWVRGHGHAISDNWEEALESEPTRPAELSMTAWLNNHFVDWLGQQDKPWFAHLSHLRPHSPYAAAGEFSKMYDPDAVPVPIAPADERHALHNGLLRHPLTAAPTSESAMRHLQAQYYGMVSEADAQLGRVVEALKASGQWDKTLVIVTSDHGEMLGDHGLIQKAAWFEQSYHILGIVRDPREGCARGAVVDAFTENVDMFPTLCEAMDIPVPAQCDGLPLTPFLRGEKPSWWREAAHWEFDWRSSFIPHGPHKWPWDRRLERQCLSVHRTRDAGYVHFGDGTWLCFDLAADPTWRTPVRDPAVILGLAQDLLTWRAQNQDRTMTGMLVENGGIGRWPDMPAGWGASS